MMIQTSIAFDKIRDKIKDMDGMGFFIGNGTFGLEKRDELLKLVDEAEDIMYKERMEAMS